MSSCLAYSSVQRNQNQGGERDAGSPGIGSTEPCGNTPAGDPQATCVCIPIRGRFHSGEADSFFPHDREIFVHEPVSQGRPDAQAKMRRIPQVKPPEITAQVKGSRLLTRYDCERTEGLHLAEGSDMLQGKCVPHTAKTLDRKICLVMRIGIDRGGDGHRCNQPAS